MQLRARWAHVADLVAPRGRAAKRPPSAAPRARPQRPPRRLSLVRIEELGDAPRDVVPARRSASGR